MEFQAETKHYKQNTEERKLRFEALKKKDEESSQTIARQMRKLHRLQESIASLKHKMALNAKESEEKTRAIRQVRSATGKSWRKYNLLHPSQDREAVLSHFHALKQEMNHCREVERSSLTKLTMQSDAAIKQLQKKREKVHNNQTFKFLW